MWYNFKNQKGQKVQKEENRYFMVKVRKTFYKAELSVLDHKLRGLTDGMVDRVEISDMTKEQLSSNIIDDKTSPTMLLTYKDDTEGMIESLRESSIPYYLEELNNEIQIGGEFYDGARLYPDLRYSKDGDLLGKMDVMVKAIELLESDKEVEALILLNEGAIRTDVGSLSRLTRPKA